MHSSTDARRHIIYIDHIAGVDHQLGSLADDR
jgi:hypothetical protein